MDQKITESFPKEPIPISNQGETPQGVIFPGASVTGIGELSYNDEISQSVNYGFDSSIDPGSIVGVTPLPAPVHGPPSGDVIVFNPSSSQTFTNRNVSYLINDPAASEALKTHQSWYQRKTVCWVSLFVFFVLLFIIIKVLVRRY